jgi:2-haloacid dehalogenase
LGELASGGPTIVVNGVEEAVKGISKWVAENGGSGAGNNNADTTMGPG